MKHPGLSFLVVIRTEELLQEVAWDGRSLHLASLRIHRHTNRHGMPGSDNHIGILSDFAAHKRVPYGLVFELFDGEMNIDFIFEYFFNKLLSCDQFSVFKHVFDVCINYITKTCILNLKLPFDKLSEPFHEFIY
jgi:hypothetical protein